MDQDTPQKLITDANAPLIAEIHNLIVDIITRLDRLIAIAGKGSGGGGGKGPKPPDGDKGSGILSMLPKFAAGLTAALTAVLAFVALPPLMIGVASSFVRAFNPGIVEALDHTLSNLQATIGYGLEPIIAEANSALKQWSGMLLPVMRELRPVIAEVASVLSSLLIVYLQAAAMQFRVMFMVIGPVIRVLAGFMQVVSTVVGILNDLVGAVLDSIIALIESTGIGKALNDVFSFLKKTINTCVIGFAVLAATVLRAVGALDTLARFKAAIERRREGGLTGLVAAPRDVTTGGIEDIARKMSERAFAAQGAATARSETELLDDILKAIEASEGTDWKTLIKNAVRDGMREARDAAVHTVADPINAIIDDVSSSATSFLEGLVTPFGGRR